MKIATYLHDGTDRTGIVAGEHIYDLAAALSARGADASFASSALTLLSSGPRALDAVRAAVDWAQRQGDDQLVHPLPAVKLRPPLPCPGKLLCLAGNYADHILESGRPFVGKEKMIPRFFMKPCTTVIATGDAIRIPPSTGFADWELELAVVVGKSGRDLSPAQADDHIAGYTIFNDISARELSFRESLPQQEGDYYFDWLVGKWLDTFGPMGPWITTADEIERPDRLSMRLWLNDEIQQDANTGQMIFSPAEAISFISQFVTLHPGDLISTGTPAGVGAAKKVRLRPGDRIRGEIEALGVLENSVEAW